MKAPYIPFYVRDWLCSRTVSSMTGNEVKAYLYLLCESWLNVPRATLPQDDESLSSMARLSMDEWLKVKTRIMTKFKIGECEEHKGFLYNDRLLEESRKSENKQRLNNKNAKRSQINRKQNANKTHPSDNANAIDSDTALGNEILNPKRVAINTKDKILNGKGVTCQEWEGMSLTSRTLIPFSHLRLNESDNLYYHMAIK